MNATSPAELRSGGASDEAVDDKLEQIRELLYGEFKRDHDSRLKNLEAQVKELEASLHRKLDAIQTRIEAMVSENATERRTSFDELSRSIFELGDRIRRISHD
jgi:polyhydroxyalkanoate synthesis regulator phasin